MKKKRYFLISKEDAVFALVGIATLRTIAGLFLVCSVDSRVVVAGVGLIAINVAFLALVGIANKPRKKRPH